MMGPLPSVDCRGDKTFAASFHRDSGMFDDDAGHPVRQCTKFQSKKLKKVTFNKYLSTDPQVPVDSFTQGDQTGFRTSVPVNRSKSPVDRYTQEIVSRKASLLYFANLLAPVDRCIKQPPYQTLAKSQEKSLSLLPCFSTPSRTKKNNLLNEVEAGSSMIQASPSTDTCQDKV
ncbi:hypothetical protein Taro_049639 [Colocasia esculenta]|uniref:Uncharacterized protein n=1 Tax=Colocasia esculenta TaxID=4460 RepID=A0A843XBK9_COLES|nr:hypothetical protein [Colocasia esculenta]